MMLVTHYVEPEQTTRAERTHLCNCTVVWDNRSYTIEIMIMSSEHDSFSVESRHRNKIVARSLSHACLLRLTNQPQRQYLRQLDYDSKETLAHLGNRLYLNIVSKTTFHSTKWLQHRRRRNVVCLAPQDQSDSDSYYCWLIIQHWVYTLLEHRQDRLASFTKMP